MSVWTRVGGRVTQGSRLRVDPPASEWSLTDAESEGESVIGIVNFYISC